MDWYEIALNPLAVANLYTNVPPLKSVHIQKIIYLADRASLQIVTTFPFPDHAPKRWQYQGYNSVQIQLGLSGLPNFQLFHYSPHHDVSIELQKLAKDSVLLEVYYQSRLLMRVNAEYLYLTVLKS